ncbi:S16 family serine protease [Sorangium sp. So ce887]|uniref:S16 family serine protease n=1 Tax=Sorangium sp. So ce887 TaxID=3133324 RepID=UPI003F5EE6FA
MPTGDPPSRTPPSPDADSVPILPLRNSVLFPMSVVPINVGRPRSVRLVEDLLGRERALVGVISQRSPDVDEPTFKELYSVGTIARVVKVIRLGPNNYSVVLNGLGRFRMKAAFSLEPYMRARIERIPESLVRDVELEALGAGLREATREVLGLMPNLPRDTAGILDNVREPGALADLIASNFPQAQASVGDKQEILEAFDVKARVRLVLAMVGRQLEVLRVKKEISSMVQEEMGKSQREYILRQQMKSIKEELGEGGDDDEIEGALPGRILQALKKAGTKNPVLVLDEVDKMGVDLRGDPAAALLEVLDPEQNSTFQDHYLDLPFDLSQVMFLATANNWDGIPGPLVDRMEVIEVPGYTRTDKLGIAREFLVPKQLSAHGLTDERLEFTEPGIAAIIDHYTREAGVRGLERQIAAVCRSTAVKVAEGHDVREVAAPEHVEQVLGPHKHRPELAERSLQPGVATGLAWTPAGGEILFIEATKMPGKGNVVLTGNMRNVMQESASTAVSFVRSKAERLHLDPEWLKEIDLHVHIPQHGTPKDGPSAGVTMFSAVASLLLGVSVRSDIAMTGEISLRGRVMPVGGIKEKLLAAHRAGIRHEDVPQDVKDQVKITMVSSMEEILPIVLEPPRRAPAQSASADEVEEQAGA